jgi:hypothetical protein
MLNNLKTTIFGRLLTILFVLFLAVMASGCAATSTAIMDEEIVTNQKPMSVYKSLIITDFELKRELYGTAGDSRMSDRELRYSRIPSEMSEGIERYVKSRRTYQSVSRNGAVTATTLVLKGTFVRIGRFRISIIGTLHDGGNGQEVAYFRQTLWDVYDTTGAVNLLSREVADFIDRIQYK